jgi:hypothetical protein
MGIKLKIFNYNDKINMNQLNLTESPEKFCQVSFYHLIPNKKYIVTEIYGFYHYKGTFSHYQKGFNDIVIFKDVTCIKPHEKECGYVSFSYDTERKFYTFISRKYEIQCAMEKRAYNKIMENLLGHVI